MNALFALITATAYCWAGATPALAAPAPPANVNFAAAQGQPFSLVLDGHVMTNPVARQVHVDQLAPGRHWADFSFSTPYGQPMQFRTTVWLEPGTETSYVLVVGTYGPQLQRVNAVAVGSPAYPPQAGPYPNGYPSQPGTYGGSAGSYPNTPGSYPNNGNGYPNGSYPNSGNSYPAPGPYGTTPAEAPPATTPEVPGTYEPGASAPGYDPNAPVAPDNNLAPLPADEVQALTQEMRNNSSDNARVDLAKQSLAQASVSAEELAQLLGTLNLDKARIALAEYGYAHLSDPQNFAVVYEMFHLPSSVHEVQQALNLPQD